MTRISEYSFRIPLLSLFNFLSSFPFLVISQPIPTSLDHEILLSIKKQWGDQPPMESWNATTSLCQWPRIQCAGDNTVIGILLGNQNITGKITPSICHLKNLTTLDLGNNFLGGEFPTFLYKCTKLQKLDLSQNLLVGQLPNDMNNLSPNLQHLNLSGNNFTGHIPSSIGKLRGLITLHLDQNLFNGTFPSELGDLDNLEELVLAYNPFLPMKLPTEFGKLKRIKFLWMALCNLINEIPESFGNLSSLEQLDLTKNTLEGGIPNGLFMLKNLRFLYLYDNRLSGEIPTSIEALNLMEIDLSDNNLTGTIPQGIASLPNLELLSLFSNHFYGILPQRLGLIPALKTLKVWSNKFSGPLPSELGLYSRLEDFEVGDNNFTGQLPENLCSGGALLGVVAFNNNLNGSIPKSLGQCNSLLIVDLYNNNLSGEIPERFWNLEKISVLRLSNNQLSGQLNGKSAKSLKRIEISNNRFYGEIPPSMGTWQQLVAFEASNNLLSGTIPPELTNLSRLNSLFLDGNHLSGELPSHIISWVNLNSLNLSGNELSGSIPSAFGLLSVLNYLDLSNNQLSGQIPSKLDHLSLVFLNLSSNKLTGGIPYVYDNVAYQTSFLNTSLCSESVVLHLPRCLNNLHDAQKFPSKYIVFIIILAFLAFLATIYFGWFVIFELHKKKLSLISWKVTSIHKLGFTEESIQTNLTVTNLIGSGSSGKVYRIPANGSRSVVAVKRIWKRKMRNEKHFLDEVQILSTISHLNIVSLLFCISSEDSKILVYEYMENQSLDMWIHAGKRKLISLKGGSVHSVVLTWPTRLRVVAGVAQGLCYMHHGCSPPIIHKAVKTSNILLDSEFNAKIGDFGLANNLAKPQGGSRIISSSTRSFGYLAPEHCYSTKMDEKIDIYNFGVVLLEVVTGKEPHNGDEHSNLAEWAWRHYRQGNSIAYTFDKEVKEDCYLEKMTDVFMLGLLCTSTLPSARPSMEEVLRVLRQCNA